MAEEVKSVINPIECFSQSKGIKEFRFIEFILVSSWKLCDLSLKCPVEKSLNFVSLRLYEPW